MIDNIFESELQERTIFKNLSVLSPHYVPPELPHRESEARKITKLLAPALRNEKPYNIFLYGNTGTGKTSVTKYITSKLQDIVEDPGKNKFNALVKTVYMNCRIYDSKYKVLTKMLEEESLNKLPKYKPLFDKPDEHLTGLPPSELFERLKKVVSLNNISLIIILDEVDMVSDLDDLVYILTRINDELENGHVSIIGISNKFAFKEKLDARSRSTLCEEELVFKPYNATQLKTILSQRVSYGLQPKTIGEAEISLIAAFAAQTNGDARYALRLLQKSGEIAQNAGKKTITKEDVQDARTKVEDDIIVEVINSLPEHQQIVLYAIAESLSRGSQYKRLADVPKDVLFSGEVYDAYERVCKQFHKKPRTMRWFREYLNELETLGLITLSVSGKGVRGNTTLIRLGNAPEEVKKIVCHSLGLE